VQLESDGGALTLQWPALPDRAHPVVLRVSDLEAQEGLALTPALLAAAAAAYLQLSVDELRWQGRSLGRLAALVGSQGGALTVGDLTLTAPTQELRASGQCAEEAGCSARLSLVSRDAAATLAACGLRADLTATHGMLEAEVRWPRGSQAPLATLSGHLHMQLEEGSARPASGDVQGAPFALFVVPGLLSAMAAEKPDAQASVSAPLRFSRLSADFELGDGEARTANLHLDGEAEILVRARLGLLTHDYDAEAFVLRGEERLPVAVRRFGPTPKVAALWLSLRDWFGGASADTAHAALRLRGTWNDPILMAAE
jgi:uncharacterized protein YhdP